MASQTDVRAFIFYLSNNAFPQPLGEQEEEMWVQRLRAGDEQARNVLIEHNLRLVAHIIKKFEGVAGDFEDLISIGTIGLIKAIKTFDPERGSKLATYAARCIENDSSKTITGGTCSLFLREACIC